MVTREGIQEAKEITRDGGVDDLIYPWERVRIFRAGFVETGEVHAEAPTAFRAFGMTTGFAIHVG
jgi:hypothetical protein